MKPNAKLSLQKHFHRAEHWVVVRGTAEIAVGAETRIVHENESTYIPIGSVHRLANPGKIPLELIEVQVGSYLGEDDIVRMDDEYGREWSVPHKNVARVERQQNPGTIPSHVRCPGFAVAQPGLRPYFLKCFSSPCQHS